MREMSVNKMKRNKKLKYNGIGAFLGFVKFWEYNEQHTSLRFEGTHYFEYDGSEMPLEITFEFKNDEIKMVGCSYTYQQYYFPRWIGPNLRNGMLESMIKEEFPALFKTKELSETLTEETLKNLFSIT